MHVNSVYTIIIARDEDGYFVGHAPALPGCHTQARSIDELMERMTEAITLWLEWASIERASSGC